MIVCDDHFLNDESMLKMCYEFLKNELFEFFVLNRFCEWSSFSYSQEMRETCVYVCVCVCVSCSLLKIE
jgi:hypothetical protein